MYVVMCVGIFHNYDKRFVQVPISRYPKTQIPFTKFCLGRSVIFYKLGIFVIMGFPSSLPAPIGNRRKVMHVRCK